MEVRPGYKQTEVGVIPKEWRVEPVQNIGHIKTGPFGTLLKASEYSVGEGTPLISVREIGEGVLRVDEHTPLVPLSVVRRLPEYILNCGDIVFGRKGAVDRSALVGENQNGWFLGSDGIRIRPSQSCHPAFIAWQFQRKEVQSWLLQHATGTTMASLNQEILRRVSLPLPPLPEQRTIAGALSDVDALIRGLDQLIAKNRDLRQAAMQQLLTGKQRLPGFRQKPGYKQTEVGVIPEDWKVEALDDIFSISGGFSASRDQLTSEGHCYLHYGDIHTSTKSFIDVRAEYPDIPKLNIPLKRVSSKSLLADGDIVFVDASEDNEGTSKHVVVINPEGVPFISGLHTIVAKNKIASLNNEYKRYCFQTIDVKRQFYFYAVGTKVSGISKTNIKKIIIPLPSKPEQRAIATVLSDMDAELAALEQRRDKTRDLKQGMMQELLTGRIRLV